MKKIILLIVLVIVLMGCDAIINGTNRSSVDKEQSRETDELMEEANRQAGMPNIINFQQKKTLKWILELCDKEKMVCYAYLANIMTGSVGQFLGTCIGYGIPYSAQYSNPEKEVYPGGYNESFGSLPQPEPSGLFLPTSSNATWLIMFNPETEELSPVYIEPAIIVSPFKLK